MWTYIIIFIGVSLGLLTFYWYKRSQKPYAPNNGLKFELPPKELYPFVHRWMEFTIDDNNNFEVKHIDDPNNTKLACIHYIDEGRDFQTNDNNICFLLCHGNPTWSFLYRKMIKILRKNYRCISIDCPGFGLSTAPKKYKFTTEQQAKILLAVTQKLKLNNIVLVQQDWGGPTGFYLAVNTQATIKGFVIGNTWCWITNKCKRPGVYAFSCIFGGYIGQSLGFGYNFVIRNFFREGFFKQLDKNVRYWYDIPFKGKYSRKGTWIWPAQIFDANKLLKIIETNIPIKYGKNTPCLLTWGTKDLAFGKYELDKFKSWFMDHKVFKLQNASHFWQEDEGEKAAKYILEWAKEKFNSN